MGGIIIIIIVSVILRCGNHYVMYGHVASESVVVGQNITARQVIALSRGFTRLPLAHLEVRCLF
jgi:murein DD-endopeptidase MepM/ murein hydrolase activator NlpD